MNIHLITYLTSKLFWIYTVFRYNTILYPQNEDTQSYLHILCISAFLLGKYAVGNDVRRSDL